MKRTPPGSSGSSRSPSTDSKKDQADEKKVQLPSASDQASGAIPTSKVLSWAEEMEMLESERKQKAVSLKRDRQYASSGFTTLVKNLDKFLSACGGK